MSRKDIILNWIKENPGHSSGEILKGSGLTISLATLKRDLSDLVNNNYLETWGRGKALKYFISSNYTLFYPINVDQYFEKEIDERSIKGNYNFGLIELLNSVSIFNNEELIRLNSLQKIFSNNISELPKELYLKEMERLAIDLSWKSSQIEGNTSTNSRKLLPHFIQNC